MMMMMIIIIIFLTHLLLTCLFRLFAGHFATSASDQHQRSFKSCYKQAKQTQRDGTLFWVQSRTKKIKKDCNKPVLNELPQIDVQKQIHVLHNDTARNVECCRLPDTIRHLITWPDTIFGLSFLCTICYGTFHPMRSPTAVDNTRIHIYTFGRCTKS